MEGKRGLRFAAAFSFYLLVAASAGGAAAGAGFAGLLHGHGVAAVHCGVDDGINVVDQVLAVALCLVVSSHTLVSHDLAVQVVDLGVQLGDALITALALADRPCRFGFALEAGLGEREDNPFGPIPEEIPAYHPWKAVGEQDRTPSYRDPSDPDQRSNAGMV